MTGSDTPTSAPIGRRTLLLGAIGAGAGWWAWPRIAPLFVGPFAFEQMADPAGFRRLNAGATSGFPGLLVGLDGAATTDASGLQVRVKESLCSALFGTLPEPGTVPIASFSDYNCPHCRILTETLIKLESRAKGKVQVTWHEWPLLGPTSHLAARAALAADLQSAYARFHKHLMRTQLIPTRRYIGLLASEAGLDAPRLLRDMDGPEVTERLHITAALSAILGLVGTPALVVGRTVVSGAITPAQLAALVARERSEGSLSNC